MDGVLAVHKMIYVFTGNGKGKTTAALGVVLRAAGANFKVLIVRFLKSKGTSSEEKVLSRIKGVKVKSFGRKGFFAPKEDFKKHPELRKMGVRPLEKIDKDLAREGLKEAEKGVSAGKYKVLILDEINMALYFRLIGEKKVLSLLKKHGKKTDIILTGRNCPREILNVADLVTEMKEVKHYYKRGVPAKRGIDY